MKMSFFISTLKKKSNKNNTSQKIISTFTHTKYRAHKSLKEIVISYETRSNLEFNQVSFQALS